MAKIVFGEKTLRLILNALNDGIRDREAFIHAYTPDYEKPGKDAAKIIRETWIQVGRYRHLAVRIRKQLVKRP